MEQQIQQMQQNLIVLKARLFDSEEKCQYLEQNIKTFLDEVANLLNRDGITMQDVYDYIKSINDDQDVEDSKDSKNDANKAKED